MAGHYQIVKQLDNWVMILFDPKDNEKTNLELKTMGKKRNTEHRYAFDYVFDEESK